MRALAKQLWHIRMPMRNLHASRIRYGVMDGVRDAYDKALGQNEQQNAAKTFAVQIKYLQDSRKFTGDRFVEFITDMKNASGMGGFKEHLPWVSNNPALGEMKEQISIIQSFTPTERENVFKIGIGRIKKVGRDLGVGTDAVEAVVSNVKTMLRVQAWMKRRMTNGELMPRDAEEMQSMLMVGKGLRRDKRPRRERINPGIKGGTSAKRKFY